MTTIREITVDCWLIELDDGENLKALNIGDAVDLDATTGHGGLWLAAEFIGESRDVVRLQAAKAIDCTAHPEITCRYAGHLHAHPVDTAGNLHPQPATA